MRALGAVIDWAPFYTRRPPRQGSVLACVPVTVFFTGPAIACARHRI